MPASLSLLRARFSPSCLAGFGLSISLLWPSTSFAQTIDLAASSEVLRVLGSVGEGRIGTPVSGGQDVDGDGLADYLLSSLLAAPQGRSFAGVVFLVLGDGAVTGEFDTAQASSRLLEIQGGGVRELAGVVSATADLTGDGLADIIIGRPNFGTADGRSGAGAITIIPGGEGLRRLAQSGGVIDLAAIPLDLGAVTIHGAAAADRFGVWLRSNDLDADGVGDLIAGADQEDVGGDQNAGAAYVIRGGNHLATAGTVDLAEFGNTALAGEIVRILPPPGATDFHFAATADLQDLDGNGLAEILIAAALTRSNAGVVAQGASSADYASIGGAEHGRLFILWDEHFRRPWPPGFSLQFADLASGVSTLSGGLRNLTFAEEIAVGDWDADGRQDLFLGDLRGDFRGEFDQDSSGSGHIVFAAEQLRDLHVDMDNLPAELSSSLIVGTGRGHISADTAFAGDFDGDGVEDLGLASPHAGPAGRRDAGAFHILFGQAGRWPQRIELQESQPAEGPIANLLIMGRRGTDGGNVGDVLGYSAIGADVDADGLTDLLLNEMLGDGSQRDDVGNLVVLTGERVRCARSACSGSPTPRPEVSPSPAPGGGSGAVACWELLLWLGLATRIGTRPRRPGFSHRTQPTV